MRTLVLGAALLLGGCAQQLLTAAQRDCGAFGFQPDTEGYAGCVQQRFGQRQAMMQRAFSNAAQTAQSSSGGGMLTDDRVEGMSRICTYQRASGPYVMTMGAGQLCPLSPP